MQQANSALIWTEIEKLIAELVAGQQKILLQHAREIIPHATSDDILQPNDFVELESNPHFRYEEGMLHGIQSVQSALQALKQDNFKQFSDQLNASGSCG